MNLSTLLRYWHTARYLKPAQVVGRLRFRFVTPSIDDRPAPKRRPPAGRWAPGPPRAPSVLGPTQFRFLNDERDTARWDDPALDKLWRYNLHYFDDLAADRAASRTTLHRELLSRWVHENRPAGGTGWEPYPTSLRIVNWIKWSLAGNELPRECAQSLAVQARWLSKRLETHLLGNHLFANAKALVFAGLAHEGDEAAQWLETGMRILESELAEQVLPDGGHFELSPMYHAIALEDVLDLCNVANAFDATVPREWRAAVPGMLRWLRVMSHPDGDIAFFNDAAFGIAPRYADLAAYAERLGIQAPATEPSPLTLLADTGYARIDAGPASVFVDVARVGPDYLPGHAHADTLSFECSLGTQRVLVNSGVSVYGDSSERQRQRGTAAHNTVVVDGADSSEVWSGFRVARRARPIQLRARTDGAVAVACAHDGYHRLPGRVTHRREWRAAADHMEVSDTLTGSVQSAVARFHLHPKVSASKVEDRPEGGDVALRLPDGETARLVVDGGLVTLGPGSWHPEFGVTVPNTVVSVTFLGSRLRTTLRWP